MVQPPAPHIKSVSFLEVKGKDVPLPCEKEEIVSIQYTIVGETQGSVDIMYLVSRSMRKKKKLNNSATFWSLENLLVRSELKAN